MKKNGSLPTSNSLSLSPFSSTLFLPLPLHFPVLRLQSLRKTAHHLQRRITSSARRWVEDLPTKQRRKKPRETTYNPPPCEPPKKGNHSREEKQIEDKQNPGTPPPPFSPPSLRRGRLLLLLLTGIKRKEEKQALLPVAISMACLIPHV